MEVAFRFAIHYHPISHCTQACCSALVRACQCLSTSLPRIVIAIWRQQALAALDVTHSRYNTYSAFPSERTCKSSSRLFVTANSVNASRISLGGINHSQQCLDECSSDVVITERSTDEKHDVLLAVERFAALHCDSRAQINDRVLISSLPFLLSYPRYSKYTDVLRNMFSLNNRGLLDGRLTGRTLTNTVCLAASSGFFLLGYDRRLTFSTVSLD